LLLLLLLWLLLLQRSVLFTLPPSKPRHSLCALSPLPLFLVNPDAAVPAAEQYSTHLLRRSAPPGRTAWSQFCCEVQYR
jgi:hypothetical protein